MQQLINKYRAEAADYRQRAEAARAWSQRDAEHYNAYAAVRERLADELQQEMEREQAQMILSYRLSNVRTGVVFATGYVNNGVGAEDYAQHIASTRADHEAVAVVELNETVGSEGLYSIVTATNVIRFA